MTDLFLDCCPNLGFYKRNMTAMANLCSILAIYEKRFSGISTSNGDETWDGLICIENVSGYQGLIASYRKR